MSLVKKSEQEVISFHQAMEGWLSGKTPKRDERYASIEDVLAEDFSYIFPDGDCEGKSTTAAGLKQAHSALGQDFRIWIRNFKVLVDLTSRCVVSYEEWQRLPGNTIQGRISTVVFRSNDKQVNGVEWLHVHETWLPEEALSTFSVPDE